MCWHWPRITLMRSACSAWSPSVAAITPRRPCFRRVLAVWPADSDLRVCLGIALYEQGTIEEAVKHCACVRTRDRPPRRPGSISVKRSDAKRTRTKRLRPCNGRISSIPHSPHALAGARSRRARPHRRGDRRIPRSAASATRATPKDGSDCRTSTPFASPLLLRHVCIASPDLGAKESLATRERDASPSPTAGRSLENQDDYAQAFERFPQRQRVAAQTREMGCGGPVNTKRIEGDPARVFSADNAPPAQAPGPGWEAILIVSIPRSGSTLVEQILASHPLVEGANEIKDMTELFDAETLRLPNPHFRTGYPTPTPKDWQRLGCENTGCGPRARAKVKRFVSPTRAWSAGISRSPR